MKSSVGAALRLQIVEEGDHGARCRRALRWGATEQIVGPVDELVEPLGPDAQELEEDADRKGKAEVAHHVALGAVRLNPIDQFDRPFADQRLKVHHPAR